MATHSSINTLLSVKKEHGGLQSMGCKESDMTEQPSVHACFIVQNFVWIFP